MLMRRAEIMVITVSSPVLPLLGNGDLVPCFAPLVDSAGVKSVHLIEQEALALLFQDAAELLDFILRGPLGNDEIELNLRPSGSRALCLQDAGIGLFLSLGLQRETSGYQAGNGHPRDHRSGHTFLQLFRISG
jgi:hypothetical protein